MAKYRGRGPHFDANMDPELLASLEAAVRGWDSPYEVQLSSGYRAGPRQHGRGAAADLRLYDQTGAELDRYQKGGAVEPFQQFANYWYQQLTPEQQAKARWGGYFGDPNDPNYGTNYGEQDWMHYDFGRTPTLGMKAGDWSTGFAPEAMQKLGLKSAGGLGEAAAQMKAAGYSDEQIKTALLTSIAGTESPGYDVLYGGGKFADYSKHPNQAIPITSGPNKGKTSSAAGRYQFINPTWEAQATKLGLKDFSPASQDAAAWDLAETTYKEATKGGSLMEALQSGDPGRINAAAKILSSQWTSLPGGIEQAGGYGTGTFAEAFNKALGGSTASATPHVSHPPNPTVGKGDLPAAGPPKKSMISKVAEGLSGMGLSAGGKIPVPEIPPTPGAARVDAPVAPIVDPGQSDRGRQQLAMILARLNQGSLV